MSMQVRVLRPLMFRGQTYEVGRLIDAEPFDAYELIASGRAVLVDQTDAAAVRKAVEAHNKKALAETGPKRYAWR